MPLCSQHVGEPCTLCRVLARVAVLLPCEQTNVELCRGFSRCHDLGCLPCSVLSVVSFQIQPHLCVLAVPGKKHLAPDLCV